MQVIRAATPTAKVESVPWECPLVSLAPRPSPPGSADLPSVSAVLLLFLWWRPPCLLTDLVCAFPVCPCLGRLSVVLAPRGRGVELP